MVCWLISGRSVITAIGATAAAIAVMVPVVQLHAQTTVPQIEISSVVPGELNPPFDPSAKMGGAPNATLEQAAAFAWQEFIALSWPAGPQEGLSGQREAPSTTVKFGDPSYSGPLVWETMRNKVEIFPGTGPPPGYDGSTAADSYGYDHLSDYNYATSISACDPAQANDPTPWINLDETNQITLNNMYAGVVLPDGTNVNSSPQLIRFLAKADRNEYVYVAGNSTPPPVFPATPWWMAIPKDVVKATKAYLEEHQDSPAPGSKDASGTPLVSLPYNTIEIKAGWRPLNPAEMASGRFHTQTVRYYEHNMSGSMCFRNATWGLVSLHVIQKTPSAPSFIYATFEQADNILTASGSRTEDENGNIIVSPVPATASTPQTCLMDPQPPVKSPPDDTEIPSNSGKVVTTDNPATCQEVAAVYCGSPSNQLYLRNEIGKGPSGGNICVNKRENAIPSEVIAANTMAHHAITGYLKQNGLTSSPWLVYKLVNVQYHPYDKVITTQTPNGSLYSPTPPYSATNPAASTYYLANIVVETNRTLQLFSGGLSPNIATDWNMDGTEHKNTYYGGVFHNMGGCMGCHGSQGQNPTGQAGDFSVILARGAVLFPEAPAQETSQGMSSVSRNRSLIP